MAKITYTMDSRETVDSTKIGEGILLYSQLEATYEWHDWVKKIPFINWPIDWEVKAIPPFSGAMVRYQIRVKDSEAPITSVYLDCYDILAIYGEPYWEVYPVDGGVGRCAIGDTDALLELIEQSLLEQAKELL